MSSDGAERLLLKKLDALLREPVQTLEQEKREDKGNKLNVKLFAEDGDGEAALDDGVTGADMKALHLAEAQRAEENGLNKPP